jgi:hypothetical protein
MELKRQELLNALTIVRPGLAKNEIIEQMTHFLFADDYIVTYNDQICVSYKFPIGIFCSVKADDFYKIVSKLEKEIVNLDVVNNDEQNTLLIKEEGFESGLPIITEHQIKDNLKLLADEIEQGGLEWVDLPKGFLEGASLCSFSASKDESQGPYTCIFFTEKNIFCGESFRVSKYEMEEKVTESFLFKASSVSELKVINPTKYMVTNSWIHFRNKDKNIMSVRKALYPKYPYEKFLSLFNSPMKYKLKLPDQFKSCVELVSILPKNDILVDRSIEIEFGKKKVVCKAKSQIGGWIKKELDIQYMGVPVTIKVDPGVLLEILSHNVTTMSFNDKIALFKFNNFKHLISLYV